LPPQAVHGERGGGGRPRVGDARRPDPPPALHRRRPPSATTTTHLGGLRLGGGGRGFDGRGLERGGTQESARASRRARARAPRRPTARPVSTPRNPSIPWPPPAGRAPALWGLAWRRPWPPELARAPAPSSPRPPQAWRPPAPARAPPHPRRPWHRRAPRRWQPRLPRRQSSPPPSATWESREWGAPMAAWAPPAWPGGWRAGRRLGERRRVVGIGVGRRPSNRRAARSARDHSTHCRAARRARGSPAVAAAREKLAGPAGGGAPAPSRTLGHDRHGGERKENENGAHGGRAAVGRRGGCVRTVERRRDLPLFAALLTLNRCPARAPGGRFTHPPLARAGAERWPPEPSTRRVTRPPLRRARRRPRPHDPPTPLPPTAPGSP